MVKSKINVEILVNSILVGLFACYSLNLQIKGLILETNYDVIVLETTTDIRQMLLSLSHVSSTYNLQSLRDYNLYRILFVY